MCFAEYKKFFKKNLHLFLRNLFILKEKYKLSLFLLITSHCCIVLRPAVVVDIAL